MCPACRQNGQQKQKAAQTEGENSFKHISVGNSSGKYFDGGILFAALWQRQEIISTNGLAAPKPLLKGRLDIPHAM